MMMEWTIVPANMAREESTSKDIVSSRYKRTGPRKSAASATEKMRAYWNAKVQRRNLNLNEPLDI
jgi:hypothetical protein